ncbi:terpenoid synthase [Hypoxylon cercidicola]|nr:terpenoid synthase [Hypoxylon cercidicola]
MIQQTSGDEGEKELGLFLRPLISSFIAEIGYHGPSTTSNETFWTSFHQNAMETGVPHLEGTSSYRCLRLGGYYAIACFPNHPLDVQVHVGIFTWLAILIDDLANQILPDIQCFHQRFATGEPQPTRLLESFAQCLRSTFHHWNPIVASIIVSSSMNFVNACALEVRPEIEHMTPTRGGQNLPWYLRERNGVGDAYAYFAFPKALYPDISCFIEAIPDLSMYVCFANDILSFYKEEKAGEMNNYIHNAARYEGKDARSVLKDTISRIRDAITRMRIVVKGRQPYEQVLNTYIVGFIEFHMKGRYKLEELGLGDPRGTE